MSNEAPASPPPSISFDPQRLAKLQEEGVKRFVELLNQMGTGKVPQLSDKRFSNEAWQGEQGGIFSWTAAMYLLQSDMMKGLMEAVKTDPQTQQRLNFAASQWTDAMSPSNFFFTNPEAQRKSVETKGESLRSGMALLNEDVARGRMSQTDEAQFQVGKNLAVTPGAVVFENQLIQLIQYKPSTAKVGSQPLLVVPPCINKFYILDLQPENSFVAYAVSQGHTVFVVSWRNPDESLGHLTWDDYIQLGAIDAIDAALAITGAKQLNALGFCVGGTIISTALSVLKEKGKNPAASLTLLTTLLDFSDTGMLSMFVDEQHVSMREQSIGKGGLMLAKELATTFSFLRPNDLVWNYVVNKYLKGEAPPAFDLLYWNSDSTNLPGPMFCWYLRNTYLSNAIAKPGAVKTLGFPVDFSKLDMPAFVYGSREDHIVPWQAALSSGQLLGGDAQFVMGASGHIAGVVNPAHKNKRSHWVHEGKGAKKKRLQDVSQEQWFDGATEQAGSWWPKWSSWLAQFKGKEKAAPKSLGSKRHQVIEPAPGRYVRERAV